MGMKLLSFIENARTTILITDDNPVNLKTVRLQVEKAGYRTVFALSGPECIKKTKSLKPDLILLDISMPGMSGIEVCRILKKDESAKDIPIIFVTANTKDDVLKEAFDAGGADYVRKPVNRVELLSRIRSALAQKMLIKSKLEEEKLQGVLEMAGAVCHELNQPLQTISGYSDLVLMNISKDSPLYKNIKNIRDQVIKMGAITKKLMRITRYETKSYIGNRKIIDISRASDAE